MLNEIFKNWRRFVNESYGDDRERMRRLAQDFGDEEAGQEVERQSRRRKGSDDLREEYFVVCIESAIRSAAEVLPIYDEIYSEVEQLREAITLANRWLSLIRRSEGGTTDTKWKLWRQANDAEKTLSRIYNHAVGGVVGVGREKTRSAAAVVQSVSYVIRSVTSHASNQTRYVAKYAANSAKYAAQAKGEDGHQAFVGKFNELKGVAANLGIK